MQRVMIRAFIRYIVATATEHATHIGSNGGDSLADISWHDTCVVELLKDLFEYFFSTFLICLNDTVHVPKQLSHF